MDNDEILWGSIWEEGASLNVSSSLSLSTTIWDTSINSNITQPLSSSGTIPVPTISLSPPASNNNNNNIPSSVNNNNSDNNTDNSNNNINVPSPLAAVVPTKKRKGYDVPDDIEEGAHMTWNSFTFGPQVYPVFEIGTYQNMSQYMDVSAKIVNSNLVFSENECAWICYKQNQFKVICVYQGPSVHQLLLNDGGELKRVNEMSVHIYAVKEVAGVMNDGMRVGLHRVGKNRVKSAKQDIEITPFTHGRVTFSNLAFEKSNSVKKPQKIEYFHIVAALHATCGDSNYHIVSKISPKIVVRGQHPGFYKDEDNAVMEETSSDNSSPGSVNNDNYDNNNNSNNHTPNSTSLSPSPPPLVENPIMPNYNIPISQTLPQTTFVNQTPPQFSQPFVFTPTNNNNYMNNMNNINNNMFYTNQALEEGMTNNKPNFILKEEISIAEFDKGEDANGWKKIDRDIIYYNGRVGINTKIPVEALTIHGNALVTGQLYKPSDRRIKSNINSVNYQDQLENVRKLRIYDYEVQSRKERGVLAQELAEVMPTAVHGVGDVELGGSVVPNLLVVNERSLLYENIGATKQLDQNLNIEKENIINVASQVDGIKETNEKENTAVKGWVQTMTDSLFKEEFRRKVVYGGLEEEFFNFQFSVFRMGPARSLFVLGHFTEWLWVLGSLFVCSNVRSRKYLGYCCLIRLLFNNILWTLFDKGPLYWGINGYLILTLIVVLNLISCLIYGLTALILNYKRVKKIIKHGEPEPPKTRLGRGINSIMSCLWY